MWKDNNKNKDNEKKNVKEKIKKEGKLVKEKVKGYFNLKFKKSKEECLENIKKREEKIKKIKERLVRNFKKGKIKLEELKLDVSVSGSCDFWKKKCDLGIK